MDLTQHQRDELMLNEDLKGIVSSIAGFLKGGLDAIKKMGAGVAQAFEEPETAKELEQSKDTVKDLLQKLKSLAPKGVDQKAFVANILNAYLNSFGVKPEEIANPKPVGAAEGGKAAEEGLPGGVPPGEPVELGKPETAVTAAASAAEVAGQNVEKAVEKAKDMKTSDVLVAWSKAISEKTGVQEKIVAIFLSKILDLKLLYGIGESREKLKNLLNEATVFYRWQKLAGIENCNSQKIIFEAGDIPKDEIASYLTVSADVFKAMKQSKIEDAKKKEIERLRNLPKDFDSIYDAMATAQEKDKEDNSEKAINSFYNDAMSKFNFGCVDALMHGLKDIDIKDFRNLKSNETKAKVKAGWEKRMEFLANPPPGWDPVADRGLDSALKMFDHRAQLTKLRSTFEKTVSKLDADKKANVKKIAPRLKKLFSDEYEKALKIDPEFSDEQLYSIFKSFDNLKYAKVKIAV